MPGDITPGPMQGRLYRLPQYDHLGDVRPFGPGEYVDRGNDLWSSEETITARMPDGQWSVLPSLWLVNGIPTTVNEDQAVQYAQQSNLNWPTFMNENWANQYANHREAIWERSPLGASHLQPALWSKKWPPPNASPAN